MYHFGGVTFDWLLILVWWPLIYIIFSGLHFLCSAGNPFHTWQESILPQVHVTLDQFLAFVPWPSLTYSFTFLFCPVVPLLHVQSVSCLAGINFTSSRCTIWGCDLWFDFDLGILMINLFLFWHVLPLLCRQSVSYCVGLHRSQARML